MILNKWKNCKKGENGGKGGGGRTILFFTHFQIIQPIVILYSHCNPPPPPEAEMNRIMEEDRKLKCLMWNARGIETGQCKKLEEAVIIDLIRQYDIIGVVESHTIRGEDLFKENFVNFHNPNK